MKYVMSLILMLATSVAFAGPTSMREAGAGKTADGRDFEKVAVSCSGKKDEVEIIRIANGDKWCLADESYCGKKINAAKKACK